MKYLVLAALLIACSSISAQPAKKTAFKDTTKNTSAPSSIWFDLAPHSLNGFGAGLGLRYRWFGFEIGGDDAGETLPSYENYSIPHSDYSVKTFNQGSMHYEVSLFYDITPEICVHAAGGYYHMRVLDLAKSNVTGLYYEMGLNRTVSEKWSFGIGAQAAVWEWLIVHAQFNSVRQYTIGLGYRFHRSL